MLFDPAPAAALVQRHRAIEYPFFFKFGEAELRVERDVFCPIMTKTSPFLLDTIDFRPGERMLDVFSGCGAFGVVAALHGATVVSIDRSEAAVACARVNAEANGVADTMRVRRGDLADPAANALEPHERFDLVVANPPLLPGAVDNVFAAALYDPDFSATTAFLTALTRHLAPTGRSYLLTSDVLERHGLALEDLCAERGLNPTLVATNDAGYERYRVHRISWRPAELWSRNL